MSQLPYGALNGLRAILSLHLILLPRNVIRLVELQRRAGRPRFDRRARRSPGRGAARSFPQKPLKAVRVDRGRAGA